MLTQPALRKIGFEGANVDSGDPVTVAVIDTGVDPFHEMLMGRTLPGLNLIDERRSTDELFDLDPTTAAMLLKAAGQSTSNRPSLGDLNPSTVALLDPSVVTLLNRVVTLLRTRHSRFQPHSCSRSDRHNPACQSVRRVGPWHQLPYCQSHYLCDRSGSPGNQHEFQP